MSVVRLAVLLALTLGAATVADPLQVHRDAVVVDLHVDTLLDLAAGKRTLDGGGGVVARMQELGMIVDVSHLSAAAFWDVLAATRGPVVATHSDAAAVQPHRRNLTDDQLRALAARGGVVGINFFPDFLGAPTLERVVAHVDHMVAVMGADYVALGTD